MIEGAMVDLTLGWILGSLAIMVTVTNYLLFLKAIEWSKK